MGKEQEFSRPNQIHRHMVEAAREKEPIKELKEADLKVGRPYIHSLDFARDVGEVAKKVDKILFRPS